MGHCRKDPDAPPKFLLSRGVGENNLFLIIVSVLGHPKGGGLTFKILCGGVMDVFWNDQMQPH